MLAVRNSPDAESQGHSKTSKGNSIHARKGNLAFRDIKPAMKPFYLYVGCGCGVEHVAPK